MTNPKMIALTDDSTKISYTVYGKTMLLKGEFDEGTLLIDGKKRGAYEAGYEGRTLTIDKRDYFIPFGENKMERFVRTFFALESFEDA